MKNRIILLLLVFSSPLFPFAVPYSNLVLDQLAFSSYSKVRVYQNSLKLQLDLHVRNTRIRMSRIRYTPAPEASWFLFLPPGSVVTELSVKMGKTNVPAKLTLRNSASATYNTIVNRARRRRLLKDPALLEEVGPDIFRLRVFPVINSTWVTIILHAPIKIKNGFSTLALHKALGLPFLIRAAERAYNMNLTSQAWSSGGTWIKGLWTYIKTENTKNMIIGKPPGERGIPHSLTWKEPQKNNPNDSTGRRMLEKKQKWQRLWRQFKRDRKIPWASLLPILNRLFFVGPSRSLIAVEPGMGIMPGINRRGVSIPHLGSPGVKDGFGGFNGSVLPRQELDRLVRFRKLYYRRIKAFYRIMETRDPVLILRTLLQEQIINAEITPASLSRFCNLANISQAEMDAYLRLRHPGKRNWNTWRQWSRAESLRIIRKKASANPLLPLYRLHVLCDFADRFNLRRYGVTPWDLFQYLEKKK